VEGRGVSHEETRGEREVFAKARSKKQRYRNGVKRGPSINPGGVEKLVRDVESGLKVTRREDKFSLRYGVAGIC